ncbi:MAG: hypothetical protein RR915_08565 [Cellulosilyticaceae bacterium]
MRRINKLTSLMLAMIMMVSFMMPGGVYEVFATGGLEIGNISVHTDGILKKGDKIDVSLSVTSADFQNKEADVLKRDIKVYFSGAVSQDKEITELALNDKRASIVIEGLTYSGNGNKLEVEVWYGDDSISDIKELQVESTTTAAEALKIANDTTINVVAGETQQISFKLQNASENHSEKGEMKLSVKDKNSTTNNIELKKTRIDIPELSPKEIKEFNFTLVVGKDVTRGIHEIEVDIDGTKQTIKLKVDSNFMPPSLEVSVSGTDGFKANVAKDVTVNLKNVGNVAARNVKVEVVSDAKVYVMDGSNVRYVESIEPQGKQSVKMKLQISDTTATTVPVQLKFSYTDDLGEKKEDSQFIYLTTTNVAVDTELNIENIIEPTGTYKVGNEFVTKFTVSGKGNIKNVKISVNGDEGIIPKSKNLFIIPEVKAGEKKQYTVTMSATDKAANSTHPIEIKAEYKIGSEDISFSQYATVNINNPEKEKDEDEKLKGTPKVIIGEYNSQPVVVKAGEQFDLHLGFLNTNKTKSVHNLKANLTIREEGEKNTGTVFTPVGGSNTFFISDMQPGETVGKDIKLYTIPSAVPKTYEISIEMEYEDAEGNPIKATENIGIPVEQVTSIEIAEVKVETVQVGMESYITAPIYNTGKTDISNVKIKMEGEGFDVQDGTKFIGNFAKGASETYEPIITPTQPGVLLGTIVIDYEDVTGEPQNLRHEFEITVMEMEVIPDMGMNPDMEIMPDMEAEKPSKLPTIVGVIIGIAIAAGITGIVLKRRKAKKDEFDIDED